MEIPINSEFRVLIDEFAADRRVLRDAYDALDAQRAALEEMAGPLKARVEALVEEVREFQTRLEADLAERVDEVLHGFREKSGDVLNTLRSSVEKAKNAHQQSGELSTAASEALLQIDAAITKMEGSVSTTVESTVSKTTSDISTSLADQQAKLVLLEQRLGEAQSAAETTYHDLDDELRRRGKAIESQLAAHNTRVTVLEAEGRRTAVRSWIALAIGGSGLAVAAFAVFLNL